MVLGTHRRVGHAAPAELDFVDACTEDNRVITLTTEPVVPKPRAVSKPVRMTNQWPQAPKPQTENNTSKAYRTEARTQPMQVDSSQETGTPGDANRLAENTRPAEDAEADAQRGPRRRVTLATAPQVKIPPTWRRVSAKAGGSRPFDSIAQAINEAAHLAPSKCKNNVSVRAAILNHLKRNPNKYQPLHDRCKPQKEIATCDWKEYLEFLGDITAWGGEA